MSAMVTVPVELLARVVTELRSASSDIENEFGSGRSEDELRALPPGDEAAETIRIADELTAFVPARPEWRSLAGSGAATVQPGKGRLTPPPSTVEQPTPSAEPNLTERLAELQHPVNGHRPHCLSNQPGDGPCNCNIATPPSIADMTPGTTFTDADGRRLTFAINPWGVKYAVTEDRREVPLPDPSTIRDVTPPPVTP